MTKNAITTLCSGKDNLYEYIYENKTLLLKHISNEHGEEPCLKFRNNKCTLEEKKFFQAYA